MRFCALASCFVIACAVPGSNDPDPGAGKPGMALSDQDKTDDTADPLVIESRVCATGTTTLGMDVSYYESSINWAAAKAGGIQYAFIRVSDGTGFHDPKFQQYWAAAKSAGVIRGAYQFFRPAQSATAQADLLISAVGSYTPGDLPPVIDVEVTGGMSASAIAAGVRTWVDRVKGALGVTPIIYTGYYFWRDSVGAPSSFHDNPLWVAAYVSHCPDIPSTWSKWQFWQYSDTGSVSGISGGVDVNRFNGSLDDLIAFANGSGSQPPPMSCASATMNRDIPDGACVQAASDENWYQCSQGAWTSISSTSGCSDTFAWCNSATLGRAVSPRSCVQAASNSQWYQCDGKGWAQPASSTSGPAGTCSASYPH